MGINFNFNNSISSLFGGGSSSSGSGWSSMLGDYASIKNGSYRKLMKAYYSEANGTSSTGGKSKTAKSGKSVAEQIIDEKIQKSKRVESKESKAYTSVKSAVGKLEGSIDKLSATDDKSLFVKKNVTTTDENGLEFTEYGYDKNAIYNALSDFVTNYNSVLKTGSSVGNSAIANRIDGIQKDTKANQDALTKMGITINTDNTLSINKDVFMKSDMEKVANLFQDTSYGREVKNALSMITDTANYEQLRGDTYTYDGTYNSSYKNGSSFNSTL